MEAGKLTQERQQAVRVLCSVPHGTRWELQRDITVEKYKRAREAMPSERAHGRGTTVPEKI